MAEGIKAQVEGIPRVVGKMPIAAILIGLAFMILVLIAEVYKPGLLTGPITHVLTSVGIKSA